MKYEKFFWFEGVSIELVPNTLKKDKALILQKKNLEPRNGW